MKKKKALVVGGERTKGKGKKMKRKRKKKKT